MIKAIGVEDVLAFGLVEALHEAVAAHADFSQIALRQNFAGLRVDDLVLDARHRVAEGAA